MKVRKKKLQLLLLANVKKNGKMKQKLQIKVFGEFDSSKDNLSLLVLKIKDYFLMVIMKFICVYEIFIELIYLKIMVK